MKLLPKVSENAQCQDPWSGDTYACEGTARANTMSSSGAVVGGWEEIPEARGWRVGSIPVEDFFYSFSMLALAALVHDRTGRRRRPP